MTSWWICLDSYQQEKQKKPQISPAQNPLKQSQVDLQLTDGSYSLMSIKYTYSLIISSFYWDNSQILLLHKIFYDVYYFLIVNLVVDINFTFAVVLYICKYSATD